MAKPPTPSKASFDSLAEKRSLNFNTTGEVDSFENVINNPVRNLFKLASSRFRETARLCLIRNDNISTYKQHYLLRVFKNQFIFHFSSSQLRETAQFLIFVFSLPGHDALPWQSPLPQQRVSSADLC